MSYKEVTHVTVEIVNCGKIDKSIESLEHAMEGKPLSLVDITRLIDIKSILLGVKFNYEHGRDCTKHPVKLNLKLISEDFEP